MSDRGWLQPRDADAAAKVISPLCMVAAAVTVLFAVVSLLQRAADVATVALTVAVAGVIVGVGWLTRYLGEERALIWGVLPFLGVVLIAAFDVASADSSVGAQVFFTFPVLYAASQLHRRGAAAVTLAAVAGEVFVVFALSPFQTALVAAGYMTAAMVTTGALLLRGAEQQDKLVRQLRQQAAIDPLTGLVTRRVLDQATQSALSGAASGEGTALIVLDVDGFKRVNDGYGHPAGDEVLVQLAALLTRGARANDVVSRLGGDEIAVLLPGCREEFLSLRAEQILTDVRSHTFRLSDGRELALSVSIGVAHAPTHAFDLRTMYAAADAALYVAKRSGRDQKQSPQPRSPV